MTPSGIGARFLMCAPQYFAVKYSINPWMDPVTWARNERSFAAASRREWKALCCTLADLGAAIELMPPVSHAWCWRAPATASGIPRVTYSGWDVGRAPMRAPPGPSPMCSAWRLSRWSLPIPASTIWIRRSAFSLVAR